ncbi:dihydroorotate dehydrogenase [Candidatus Bipolaricaulota bacterium]|nr:dihydroorotate dehydrogenase [Candidatus Bipolaricaulota bacterium]
MVDVVVHALGHTFASPVVLASGPAGFGLELEEEVDLSSVGALTTKTVTPEPLAGNPQPRLVDCSCGALNSIGLENPGIDRFAVEVMPRIAELPTRLVVSLAAGTPDGIASMLDRLTGIRGIDAIELNLSCPNVSGGVTGGNPDLVRAFTEAGVRDRQWPVLVKLPGDAGNLLDAGAAALDAGADGLTLINTLRGLRIDRSAGRPFLHREIGGLSGPAILPVALARVYEARRAFPETVIVGTGGVCDVGGLLEMLFAGANLVGIGFGVMADPELPQRLRTELKDWLAEYGFDGLERIVGVAHRGGFDVH